MTTKRTKGSANPDDYRGRPDKSRRSTTDLYFGGRVPWAWLAEAGRLPGKALQVAMVVRLVSSLEKTATVKLRQTLLTGIGVDRKSAYRGLAALESAGLVAVDRKRGRLAIVTILELDSDA